MSRITENTIEDFSIKLLEHLGYDYIYAPDISPDSENPERPSYEEVLLSERMANAVRRINPSVSADSQAEALKEVQRINSPELLANNETFHRTLTDGIKVSHQKDGNERGDLVWLIDFNNPNNNDFVKLSEDFLLELKGMEHKNVALEVLKKLLNDEIKARSKKNLVQSKSLMEMLENSIKRYHNKILTAAEVMDELIKLINMDSQAKTMGLTDFEYAFYTAVANNDSAKELMQQDKLSELAVILTERVKKNASIDWTIKESVKAKLKVIIKRTLRQFGYPPDMQKLATETVLKQAEMIAKELTDEK